MCVGGGGGTRIQMADKVHVEVNLGKLRRVVLKKCTLNSGLGWTIIIGEGAKDISLTSNRWGIESKGEWHNPRGDKGNLVLNKEEKKKEGQSGHPLCIKCTATT